MYLCRFLTVPELQLTHCIFTNLTELPGGVFAKRGWYHLSLFRCCLKYRFCDTSVTVATKQSVRQILTCQTVVWIQVYIWDNELRLTQSRANQFMKKAE